MFMINGTGLVVLLTVSYFGMNTIVKGAVKEAKKVADRIQKRLEERKEPNK